MVDRSGVARSSFTAVSPPSSNGCGWRLTREGLASAGASWPSSSSRPPPTPCRCFIFETNASLNEAIALYRSSGYTEVAAFNDEPYANHWFEKVL